MKFITNTPQTRDELIAAARHLIDTNYPDPGGFVVPPKLLLEVADSAAGEIQKLRQLLSELYVSSRLWDDNLPESEQVRLLDTVLAASEGREFELLGLPFPRAEIKADQT